MPRKLSGLFLIVCTLVAMYAHEELNGGQRGPLSFNELMMQPHEPLSSTDAEELKGIERDYNRDIDYLCATSIHTVPKIIHFIWIGPRAFPKNSIDNLKSWKQYHPHWKFYFWTDSKDRPLPMSGMERRLIQEYDFGPVARMMESSDNWGEKADLIRYTILYNEGGIYSDHDVEALRSLAPIAKSYDFVVGLEWYNYHLGMDSCVSPCNAIIISRPNHPIMKETIARIAQTWDEVGRRFPGKDPSSVLQRVIGRTFDSMAVSVKKFRNRPGYRDIILPNSYFYPFPAFDKPTTETLRKAGYVFAIHKFGGTWKEWNGEVSVVTME